MDDMMPKIATKDAIETVKSYFSKLYGEDDFARAAGVPPPQTSLDLAWWRLWKRKDITS